MPGNRLGEGDHENFGDATALKRGLGSELVENECKVSLRVAQKACYYAMVIYHNQNRSLRERGPICHRVISKHLLVDVHDGCYVCRFDRLPNIVQCAVPRRRSPVPAAHEA